MFQNFLPEPDSSKTFWHLGSQDPALFAPLPYPSNEGCIFFYRQGAGQNTDPVEAMRYLQNKGVDLVYTLPALVRVLDKFARYLYEMNVAEQEFQPEGKIRKIFDLNSFLICRRV